MDRKTLSVASANGWWAGYGKKDDTNGPATQYFHRIVVWAVCETHHGTSIEAVDTLDIEEGGFSVCSDNAGFVGVFHDSDFSELGKVLLPSAQERFEAGLK
jgi:hypothetical protein